MPNQKNLQQVKDLESKLENSSAVYLADYAGLAGSEQVQLRAAVEQAGGQLKITKNSLLKIALKNRGLAIDSLETELTGPNITLYAGEDAIAPLKAVVEFAKKNEKELPVLKTGFLGTELLSLAKIKQLASLPSKQELIAKLLGTLTNPARNLVGVLSAPTRNLVYALNAIKTSKSN